MKRVLWFCLFLFIGASCLDQPDCFRQDVNLIGIYFKKMYDGKADTVALYQVSTSIDGKTIKFDSLKYTSYVNVPLNYLSNSTTYSIEQIVREFLTRESETNTLTVGHKTKVQFVSEDCGERFVTSDLELLNHTYDSIQLISSSPSNPAHINIAVYRCPRMNIMRLSFRQLYVDNTDLLSQGKPDLRPITLISNNGTPLLEDTTLSAVLLPLDPDNTSTKYDFKFDNGDEHSLTLNYKIDTKTIVKRCGSQNVYSALNVTDNANGFGILKISKTELKDPPVTNIETYRCPTTDEIKVSFKQNRGSSKPTDTLHVVSLKADFLTDPVYTDSAATAFILPLNPASNSTLYTFTVTGEATETLTLKVNYTATAYTFHEVCKDLTLFTGIVVDGANSTFSTTSDIKILDAATKFPVGNNIEITRK